MTDPETRARLAEGLAAIAREAGDAIMAIYDSGDIDARVKDDASPVTAADEAADAVILAGLKRLAPEIPAVTEEEVAAGRIPETGARFFLVDPLDGTKEFISRNGEFTVNIALIEAARPTMGVVYAPAIGRLFWTDGAGRAHQSREGGAARPITVRPAAPSLTVVASRSHRGAETDAFLEHFEVGEFVAAGSSLKLCLIAAGEADLYPRLGRTMEWDIAAGLAVLTAAGGEAYGLDASPLRFGKPGFENPHFVAAGFPVAARLREIAGI